jgi:hypothetical protein
MGYQRAFAQILLWTVGNAWMKPTNMLRITKLSNLRREAGVAHGGEKHSISVDVCGDGSKFISFETGIVGKQAAGAVMVQSGGTVLYNTVCYESRPGDFDFIPLRFVATKSMRSMFHVLLMC